MLSIQFCLENTSPASLIREHSCFTVLCKVFLLVSINIYLWGVNYWPRASRTAAVLGRLCSNCRRAERVGSGPRGQLLDQRKGCKRLSTLRLQTQHSSHPLGAGQADRKGYGHPKEHPGQWERQGVSSTRANSFCRGPQHPANRGKWINSWNNASYFKLKCELHE